MGSRFFIGLEFALGLLMLLPFYVKQLMQFTFLLLGGFTIHLIYLWSIGDTENCGCFGEMISMTPEQSIIKNLIMLGVAFVVYRTAEIKKMKKNNSYHFFSCYDNKHVDHSTYSQSN